MINCKGDFISIYLYLRPQPNQHLLQQPRHKTSSNLIVIITHVIFGYVRMTDLSLASLLLLFLHCKILAAEAFTPVHLLHPQLRRAWHSSSPRSTLNFMTSGTKEATLTEEHMQALLGVAIAASKKAGEIILGNAGGAEVTERKANSRDLLTLVDPLCEKVRYCL